MNGKCVVIGASEDSCLKDLKKIIKKDDLLICADGGYNFAIKNKIVPDLVIGDMDSIKFKIDSNVKNIVLPKEKDETDTMAAVKNGLARGYKDFLILGALGSRLDHTYANLCVLRYLCDNNAFGKLVNKDSCIFTITAGKSVNINQKKGKTISVFPFGCDSCTISYVGLKYKLNNQAMSIKDAMGVSNVIIDNKASITVHSGFALVFLMLIEDFNKKI